MKRLLILILFLEIGVKSFAQIDNYSDFGQILSQNQTYGSTRILSLGGNHVALGGDLSNISQNPAGIGFYSRSEMGISLGINSRQAMANYIGNSSSSNELKMPFNHFGIVFGGTERNNNNIKSSLGISYSLPRYFNLNYSVSGTNNASSLLDWFVQKANQNGETGASLDAQYDANTNTANNLTAAAYQAYLINPDANSGGVPFWRWEANSSSNQQGYIKNTGRLGQWSIAYGLNYLDKVYFGIGMNFIKLNLTNQLDWRERFSNATNVLGFSTSEQLVTKGTGINVSTGLIIRPNAHFQLGINLTTPSIYTDIYEEYSGSLTPDVKSIPSFDQDGNPTEIVHVNPVNLTTNQFYYNINTPFKLDLGGVFFIQKKGFLSASVGTMNFAKTNISTNYLTSNIDNNSFGNYYNDLTKNNFQRANTIKLGGEYKLNQNFSVRLGYNFTGNPYQKSVDDTKREFTQFSGGIGFKTNRYYIDAAYIYSNQKLIYTPYTLNISQAYASSEISLNQSLLQITVGTFF